MSKKIDLDLEYAFRLEPKDMVQYFNSKGLKVSNNWYEVYEEAHAKAFTVARMTKADLLKDTQELVSTAIKEGWGKGEFSARANELFQKKGWSGTKTIKNADGTEYQIELGTPRRIKNIYHSNMISAQAASRYKQQLEDIDIAPYFQYMCILDDKTRPEHRAMHGKVFRYDDPLWASLYPPNGWGCRCFVRSLTSSEVNRKGLSVEKSNGKIKELETIVGNEPKKISAYEFELGGKKYTLRADAGWSTNIGTHAWGLDVQAWNKIKDLPEDIKDKFISEMASNPYRKSVIDNLIKQTLEREGYASRGLETAITWFTPKIIKSLKYNNIPYQSPIVTFEDRQVKHSLAERKVATQRLIEDDFKEIYDYINNPDEVFIDTKEHAIVFVKFLEHDKIVDGRDCIKIPVIINSTHTKRPVNYIGTTGRIIYQKTFGGTQTRYKKIE